MSDTRLSAETILGEYFYKKVVEFLVEKFGNNVKFDIVSDASQTDSFVSDIYRIKVTNNEQDKNTDDNEFVLKIIRPSRVSKEVSFISESFVRENTVYSELFKEYGILEKEFDLRENERFRYVQVFKHSSDKGEEFIIMEDLNKLGFEMAERHSTLDEKHISLIAKDFAKIHALSFALRTYKPQIFFKLLPEVIVREITQIQTYISLSNQKAIDILDHDEDKTKLSNYLKSISELQSLTFDQNVKNPYYVLCHADCWINNFMFKYGMDRTLTDAIILDWQMMAYSSPIQDIIHLIFLTTDAAFRKEYYSKVIDQYYEDLSNNLMKFKLSIDEIYPKDKFESDRIEFLSHGIGVAIGGLPFVLCEKDDKITLDDVYGEDIDHSKVIYTELVVRRLKEVLLDILSMI